MVAVIIKKTPRGILLIIDLKALKRKSGKLDLWNNNKIFGEMTQYTFIMVVFLRSYNADLEITEETIFAVFIIRSIILALFHFKQLTIF